MTEHRDLRSAAYRRELAREATRLLRLAERERRELAGRELCPVDPPPKKEFGK